MKRYSIRNNRSGNKTKPRLFDVILYDDGKMEIEIKNKNGTNIIPLEDIRHQIREIEQKI